MRKEKINSNNGKSDKAFKGIVVFIIILFFGFIGYFLKVEYDNHQPFEERHIEQVAMLREHFGEESEVYPPMDRGKYFVVTPEGELRAADVWGENIWLENNRGPYDFESELLEEPYITERQEDLYDRFVSSRRMNARYGDPYNQ